MIYDILFAVCGIGLIALGLSLVKLGGRVDHLQLDYIKHEKYFTNVDWHRAEDLGKLADTNQRVQALEDRLEAHAAELTEHHNKIDTLEINGSVYESIFEQQGLWGEETAEHSDDVEALEFPDPKDEQIII
jgi:hypothetical protein